MGNWQGFMNFVTFVVYELYVVTETRVEETGSLPGFMARMLPGTVKRWIIKDC